MKRKDLLWLFISTLVATAIIPVILPSTTAQEKAAIAVSPLVIDTRNLKQVGETFSVNVTIAHVTKLWGYQYALFYNTSVINVTNFEPLDDRFQKPLPSEIGDDFVAVGRGTFDGDSVGITTADPIPVDRIDFIVTGSGTTSIAFSPQNPKYTALAAIGGLEIECLRVFGRFSNTQILETHDVGITEASLSRTSAEPGDTITISVVVNNVGDTSEDVTVIAKFNETGLGLKQIGTPQTINDLAPDSSSDTLTFTWDTAGVIEQVYEVTVYATIPVDDKGSDNVRVAGIVKLGKGGGGGIPIEIIYVAAGIAIVVIAVVAVYALRARK